MQVKSANATATIKTPEPTRVGPTGVLIFEKNGIPYAFDLIKSRVGETVEIVSRKNGFVRFKRAGQIGNINSPFPILPEEFFEIDAYQEEGGNV